MVTVRDFFVEMATSAEGRIEGATRDSVGLAERERNLLGIRSEFERMTADGKLDQQEVGQLLDQIKRAGLSGEQLASLYASLKNGDAVTDAGSLRMLRTSFDIELGSEVAKVRDKRSDLMAAMAEDNSDANLGYATAADYNKKTHDVSMAIIRNMAG
jgi:hypothetical protein